MFDFIETGEPSRISRVFKGNFANLSTFYKIEKSYRRLSRFKLGWSHNGLHRPCVLEQLVTDWVVHFLVSRDFSAAWKVQRWMRVLRNKVIFEENLLLRLGKTVFERKTGSLSTLVPIFKMTLAMLWRVLSLFFNRLDSFPRHFCWRIGVAHNKLHFWTVSPSCRSMRPIGKCESNLRVFSFFEGRAHQEMQFRLWIDFYPMEQSWPSLPQLFFGQRFREC